MDPTQPPPSSEYRGAITLFVAVFTFTIATTAVVLRIVTRAFIIRQFGLDDAFAIFAWLCVFGCDFAVTYNLNYGLGRHVGAFPPEWIPDYLKTFYVSIALYNASLMVIKFTFLAQYYRIFKNSGKINTIAFNSIAAIVCSWAISQLLIAIFVCRPISGFWAPTADSYCIADHPFWEINAAGNIVTDVMVLVTPIPMLYKLNVPRRQRWVLIAIFSLGVFTVAISLVRLRYLKQSEDFTYENVESSGWSMGELASGLTCACLPTLRPLFARCLPWMSTSPTGESYYYRSGSGGVREQRNRPRTKSDRQYTGGSSRSGALDTLVSVGGEEHEMGDDKAGRWKVNRVLGEDVERGQGAGIPVADAYGRGWERSLNGGVQYNEQPTMAPYQREESTWTTNSSDGMSGLKDAEADIGMAVSNHREHNGWGAHKAMRGDQDEEPLTPPPAASGQDDGMYDMDDDDEDKHSRRWEVERRRADGRRWVQPAVKTQIVAPLASHPPAQSSNSGITVQRDVLLTKERARP